MLIYGCVCFYVCMSICTFVYVCVYVCVSMCTGMHMCHSAGENQQTFVRMILSAVWVPGIELKSLDLEASAQIN